MFNMEAKGKIATVNADRLNSAVIEVTLALVTSDKSTNNRYKGFFCTTALKKVNFISSKNYFMPEHKNANKNPYS